MRNFIAMDDYRANREQQTEEPTIKTLDLPDDDRAPVQKFDPDLLPESVRGFVIDAADRMQCPIDFLAVTAMVAAGSLVGRKVLMKPKQLDDWKLAPNLWGAVIGRPSAMKSPAISAALQPLRNIEQEMKISHNKEIEQIEIQKAMIEAGAEERKKQMKVASKNKDVTLAAAIMAEGKAPEAPALPRLSVNNSTIEKLGELLAKTNNGLLMERDELAGWLAKLGGKDGGEDRAFYLELYDRLSPYAFDRIMRGTVMIEHPILSIIGGIQPSKIAGVVRGAVSGESDDGLIQRFQLMAYPDNEESFSYRDRVPDQRAYAAYMGVMRGLSELPMPDRESKIWGFTETAQPLFVEWYSDTMTRARSSDMPNALESHMTKMGKPISALALLLELLDGGASGAVGEVATMRALGWAEYLESHAKRVYSSGTASATAAAKTILANKSKLPDVFTMRDVYRKGWKGVTEEITEDALDLLIDCNYLMASTTETRANGRPTTRFSWAG
ncbi:YfjI family protein [Thiothrix lacustris]|uniref:YfjI family protein n=1 Tax=Thiothrix lacustris TaxID=525917 RepID=UPI0006891B31|nr:YfjI family protein [Thiothrix lacustris]